jgi:hypothetical protein
LRSKVFLIGFLIALPLAAQTTSNTDLSNYLGPGVTSPGVGDVGTASGRAVDLRFFAGVSGIYDTNIQPFVTDAQGNLIHVPNLVGIGYNAGAYGSHNWVHSKLALSYTGDYREYPNHATYDGTNQSLTLGYTWQPSARLVIDTRISGYILNQAAGVVADDVVAEGSPTNLPLFDTRTYSGMVSASATYLQSARDSFTFGGGGNTMRYQVSGLSEYSGAFGNASYLHRVTQRHSVGLLYGFSYQDSSNGSFSMTAHSISGQYAGDIGNSWILNVSAGVSFSHSHQLVAFQVDPQFAVLLPFDVNNIFPVGHAELKRVFRRAVVGVDYSMSVGGGNGLSQASRSEGAHGGVSYTGIRKWNIGLDGNFSSFTGFGGPADKTQWYGGGMGFTYELMRYVHVVARIDALHYDLGGFIGRRTTERATLGLSFTPKDIPLALW